MKVGDEKFFMVMCVCGTIGISMDKNRTVDPVNLMPSVGWMRQMCFSYFLSHFSLFSIPEQARITVEVNELRFNGNK